MKLKSSEMFQHSSSPTIPKIITEGHSREDLLIILSELDRRCSQLWDKVAFERENELVNYKEL